MPVNISYCFASGVFGRSLLALPDIPPSVLSAVASLLGQALKLVTWSQLLQIPALLCLINGSKASSASGRVWDADG